MNSIMLEIPQTSQIQVPDAELARLLCWPRNRELDSRTRELVAEARRIFARHARPWLQGRLIEISQICGDAVRLVSGDELVSPKLAERASACKAHAIISLAATSGQQIAEHANQLWAGTQPDLAFILSALSIGFVEQAIACSYEHLCARLREQGMAVTQPLSPGNDGWDLSGQSALYRVVAGDVTSPPDLPLKILPSGALDPAASLMAAMSVTRHTELVTVDPTYRPCAQCSLRGCQFRRVAQVERP